MSVSSDVCQWYSFWPTGEPVNHGETAAKVLVHGHDYYVQVNMVKPCVRYGDLVRYEVVVPVDFAFKRPNESFIQNKGACYSAQLRMNVSECCISGCFNN